MPTRTPASSRAPGRSRWRGSAIAEGLGDDGQLAVALDNLAAQLMALGFFPEALAYRERGEAIHRRQKDNARLSFDLQNRAELLIRLGRGADADAPLKELDAGAAAGIEVFAQRARRVRQLRALRATFEERFDLAARFAFEAVQASSGKTDSTTLLSVALLDHAIARGAAAPGTWSRPADTPALSNATTRELRFWQIAAASARGEHAAAVAAANAAFTEPGASLSVEDHWRVAATGAASALALRDEAQASALRGIASKALGELTAAWKSDAETYTETAGPRPSTTAGRDGISSLTGGELHAGQGKARTVSLKSDFQLPTSSATCHPSPRKAPMILLKQILVATDFGDASEVALNYGRALARTFGASLHLLHVMENQYRDPCRGGTARAQSGGSKTARRAAHGRRPRDASRDRRARDVGQRGRGDRAVREKRTTSTSSSWGRTAAARSRSCWSAASRKRSVPARRRARC